MKNIDSAARSHFLKSCMLSFPYLFLGGIICGYAFGGILGALLGVFAAVLLSMIVGTISMLITGTVGGITSGLLYGRGKSTFSLRERLEGDLQQVRHHKMNKNFDKALELIDGVLEQDPNFPDALFLKAQILWEGFKDSNGAKECLSRVINIVPNKGESIHRWASQLLLEIN
jgi:tetratricopeptide (TPR) repeat protein